MTSHMNLSHIDHNQPTNKASHQESMPASKPKKMRPNKIHELNEQAIEYYARDDYAKASELYNEVLTLDANNLEAMGWRAEIAIQQDEHDLAVNLYKALHRNALGSFQEYGKLGYALYELGRTEEAVNALFKAVRLNPDDTISHSNLGKALYDLFIQKKTKLAQRITKLWLNEFPNNPDAAHMAPSILSDLDSAIDIPLRANPAFVRELFDGFAESFDNKVHEINYQAPEHITRRLLRVLNPTSHLDVLDIGCGTGLSGQVLKPFAKHLTGIDISKEMLAKARERNIYNHLIEGDIPQALQNLHAHFDIIVAADVFCYFGALSTIHSQISTILKPGGYLCYSVEAYNNHQGADTGYKLTASGRYMHHQHYIQQCANQVGFIIVSCEHAILRSEYDQSIEGFVVLVRKPNH